MNYPSVPENAVFEHGGELKTDSRKVAAAFGLQHSHVCATFGRLLRKFLKILANPYLDWRNTAINREKYASCTK